MSKNKINKTSNVILGGGDGKRIPLSTTDKNKEQKMITSEKKIMFCIYCDTEINEIPTECPVCKKFISRITQVRIFDSADEIVEIKRTISKKLHGENNGDGNPHFVDQDLILCSNCGADALVNRVCPECGITPA